MRSHETVGAHVGGAPRARAEEMVGQALARLAAEKAPSVDLVLVVDAAHRLQGVVPIGALFAADARAPLAQVMQANFPRVGPDTDQERAASLALHHGVDALPVVDAEGRALGVMPSQALLQVLRREHVEDLHRIAGIRREAAQARHAIEDPPLRRARHRLPWLAVGLAGSALATGAMAAFETTLQQTIAVRSLSLTRAGIVHLLAGELRTGMLLGAILGLAAFVPVWLAFGDARLGAAVATAIFAAGTMAAGLGLILPWWIARSGRDPAFGSGPLATVIQDILSILVYLGVVRAFGL